MHPELLSPTNCPHPPTFPLRWRTAARMVRAGYNVLLMDTDVLLINDPYEFWKKPPFSKFQILAQVRVEGGTEVRVCRLSSRQRGSQKILAQVRVD